MGCGSNNSAQVKERSTFFSTKQFLASFNFNDENQGSFTKTITLNGKSDRQRVDTVNYLNDLSMMLEGDISAVSLDDKFKLIQSPSGTQEYTSLSDKQLTDTLVVQFDEQEEVQSIYLRTSKKTELYTSHGRLFYKPAEGYEVHKWRSSSVFTEQDLKITVQAIGN